MQLMAETNDRQKKKLFLNLLAIVGFVIVIAVVVLGLFRLATLAKPWLYSLFSLKAKSLQIAVPPKEEYPVSIVSTTTLSATQPSVPSNSGSSSVPDLSVRILSAGVIDPISGDIIPRSSASPNDLVAVRFLISNDGGAATGPWYFTAQLPTTPAYPYSSPVQISLPPKGSIENMLRFKNATPGGVFSVSVDSSNQVSESNEGNNTANQNI